MGPLQLTLRLLCTYMSAVLLAGLLLNATVGWWWADPIAGLIIAAIAANEGREAWRGDGCSPTAMQTDAAGCSGDCTDGCS